MKRVKANNENFQSQRELQSGNPLQKGVELSEPDKKVNTIYHLVALDEISLFYSHSNQKLLWAVSNALEKAFINENHPDFKEFAVTLAKVVRRSFLQSRSPTGSVIYTLPKYVEYFCDILIFSLFDSLFRNLRTSISALIFFCPLTALRTALSTWLYAAKQPKKFFAEHIRTNQYQN